MGLVATMTALVLGLLVSSAKSFYDAQSAELTQVSARVILLDRLLAHYGPETKEARDLLRGVVADNIDRVWPQKRTQPSKLGAPSTGPEALLVKIQELSPKDDRQRSLHGQALNIVIDLAQTRWLMYEQGVGSVSGPMLVIPVFWLRENDYDAAEAWHLRGMKVLITASPRGRSEDLRGFKRCGGVWVATASLTPFWEFSQN